VSSEPRLDWIEWLSADHEQFRDSYNTMKFKVFFLIVEWRREIWVESSFDRPETALLILGLHN